MRASRLHAAGVVPIASVCSASIAFTQSADGGAEDGELSKTVISSAMRDNYFVKMGTPELHDSIMIHYDSRTRNAKWVVEHLRKSSGGAKANRKDCRFHQDFSIDVPEFRAMNEHYVDSKMDRGHLAAAANWRHDNALMKGTFSLMNVSPQEGAGFNRSYWARLEAFVRHLTNTFDDVKVCTGPVFAPARLPNGQWVHMNRTIGEFPRLVSVPTHFFKVIYGIKHQGPQKNNTLQVVGAFMIPNKPIDKDLPLEAFAIKLGDLESLTGTRFLFTGLSLEQRIAVDKRWEMVPQLKRLALGETLEYSLSYGVQKSADHATLPEPPLLIDNDKTNNSSTSVALLPLPPSAQICHLCEVVPCILPKPYPERVKGRSNNNNNNNNNSDSGHNISGE